MKDPTIPERLFNLLPDNKTWTPVDEKRSIFTNTIIYDIDHPVHPLEDHFTHEESLMITYEKGLPDIDHSATCSYGNKTAQYPVYL